MSLFQFRNQIHVGLDIHPPWVHLLKLRHLRNGFKVEAFAACELPESIYLDGKFRELALVRDKLATLVTQTKSQGCLAAVAITGQRVVTKHLCLPDFLTEDELTEKISAELPKHVPTISEALYFDFAKLPASEAGQCGMLLVAAKREQVNILVNLANTAGLKIVAADVDVYAIARATSWSIENKHNVIASIDIGATTSQFIVVHQSEILFSQSLSFGTALTTPPLAVLNPPTAYAENDGAFSVFQKNLLMELKRVLQQATAEIAPLTLQQIQISKRDTHTTGLAAFVQRELGIRVQAANPFQNMQFASDIDNAALTISACRYLTATGLAMRSIPRW